MPIPPFWRGRAKNVPTGNRIARFQAVLKAAEAIPVYRERLASLLVAKNQICTSIEELERALILVLPLSASTYFASFASRRLEPVRIDRGDRSQALLVPYEQARRGLDRGTNFLSGMTTEASSDLFHLAGALGNSTSAEWSSDHAVVVFTGMREGALTAEQRDRLWHRFQVPLFEHFLGPDGRVIAAECEIHAGLHIRPESALIECVETEIVLTSLTDLESPAIRVQTGLAGDIESAGCDCGVTEPRIVNLRSLHPPQTQKREHVHSGKAAFAVA